MEKITNREWSKFYRFDEVNAVEALHARFVGHRYPRHVHDYFVVGLVESGAQSYSYRGSKHITPAGQVFVVNPDEPHTGESATPEGYVYRTLYLTSTFLARAVEDLGCRAGIPFLKGAVISDPALASLLSRFHGALSKRFSRAERESFFSMHLLDCCPATRIHQ